MTETVGLLSIMRYLRYLLRGGDSRTESQLKNGNVKFARGAGGVYASFTPGFGSHRRALVVLTGISNTSTLVILQVYPWDTLGYTNSV